jgi:homoserine O-acetyltransferase/methionine biosynthesis protein MetW
VDRGWWIENGLFAAIFVFRQFLFFPRAEFHKFSYGGKIIGLRCVPAEERGNKVAQSPINIAACFTRPTKIMNTDIFESSDSVRHARPLRYAQYVTFDEPMELELGGRLPKVTLAYETYGRLNSNGDNAVLVCHALSGDSHVARHDDADDPGWWDIAIGPGKAIDTDRYFVICPNILGGCRGTTGPYSINPETGRPYGADFPVITVGDIAETQRRLIDHLGIGRLRGAVGASLGGNMVLAWAMRYGDRLAGAIAIGTSARLTSQALAFDIVGRNAILRDPAYQNGQYYDQGPGPVVGLAIARMLGHITYLSLEAMTQKFDARRLDPREIQTQFETKFAVGSYLAYQGDRFGERFDANSYITLTTAIDMFDLGDTAEKLMEAFRSAKCRWLMLSFTSDWLFPAFQTREIVDALIADDKPVSYCNVRTDCGHDAFLLPNELETYGELISAFLANLDAKFPIPLLNALSPQYSENALSSLPTNLRPVPGEGKSENALSPLPTNLRPMPGEGKSENALSPLPTNLRPVPGEGKSENALSPLPSGEGKGEGLSQDKCVSNRLSREDLHAPLDSDSSSHGPQSIFHHHRLDYNTIMELIPPGSSVLDLGCGTGGLLARLRERGPCRLMGIELDEQAILACVRRGLDVVQADLNQGLPAFADGQFDFVVLSQTLQTVMDAPRVLADMLRVGRKSIVSFPNIAYKVHRRQLNEGFSPHGHALQNFRWYETPNVRFLSIADFQEFCRQCGFNIIQQIALDTEADAQVLENPNLNADLAIVVLGR